MPDIRLIDANSLLAECEKAYYFEDRRGQLAHCIRAIKSSPTIDAQPVKHGRWKCVNDDEGVWMCANCGGEISLEVGNPEEFEWIFCPYCGAYMGGKRKE